MIILKKWRCTVCGYIHEGDTPPEKCPICGVGPDKFELVEETNLKKWKCTVCGYIYEGDTPPEKCPICGVGPDKFELIEEPSDNDGISSEEKDRLQGLLFNLSYGLYIISSKDGEKLNGMTSNSFIQITDAPLRGCVTISKGTRTAEMIHQSGIYGVSVLNQENHKLVQHFGFQSGHTVDKFKDISYITGEKTGCPGIPSTLCFIELEVEKTIDLDTHYMFIGKVVGGENFQKGEPMTYAYYRATR
ncbi:MAG: flavin reductase [Eubacterium sp.]